MWKLARFASATNFSRSRRFSAAIPGPCIVHQRGADILHDPWFNKDTGFPLTERDRLGLRGLLPPRVISFEQQYDRFSHFKFLRRQMSDLWTPSQERAFMRAIATLPEDEVEQWDKIAALVPGSSPAEVREKFQELQLKIEYIETAPADELFPDGYTDNCVQEPVAEVTSPQNITKKTPPNQSDKRMIWTPEEHELFLFGLKTYGRGAWKNISRDILKSKTPTQIASHAQKYFLHQNKVPKKRKRTSIHDIQLSDSDLAPQQNQVPMQQSSSSQQNMTAPLNVSHQLPPQQNWVPPLNDQMQQLSFQQNQVHPSDAQMHQLSFQQNWDSSLNVGMHQLSPQQNWDAPLNVPHQLSPLQQNCAPPLNDLMHHCQERNQTSWGIDWASIQHQAAPLNDPMHQLQERQQVQKPRDSRDYGWEPIGNRGF